MGIRESRSFQIAWASMMYNVGVKVKPNVSMLLWIGIVFLALKMVYLMVSDLIITLQHWSHGDPCEAPPIFSFLKSYTTPNLQVVLLIMTTHTLRWCNSHIGFVVCCSRKVNSWIEKNYTCSWCVSQLIPFPLLTIACRTTLAILWVPSLPCVKVSQLVTNSYTCEGQVRGGWESAPTLSAFCFISITRTILQTKHIEIKFLLTLSPTIHVNFQMNNL